MNKTKIEIFYTIILFVLVLFLFVYIPAKLDKKRCEENGGIYIWEFSYGNKCHLVEKVE